MRIMAIDPGLSGAWAVIIDGQPAACGDMPVADEGAQRRVAAIILANRMREYKPDLCVIESVHSMPNEGVSSAFRFGRACGAVDGTAGALTIPVQYVTPQVWKRHHGLIGKDKEASRAKAMQLAPVMATWLQRKLDHNRAEALLIGLYAEATFGLGEVPLE